MNRQNLYRSLEAIRFYYDRRYEAMRPAHEKIRLEQKQILIGLYREAAEMESRLRAMEAEFGYKYSPKAHKFNPYHDDLGRFASGPGGGDDSTSGNNDNDKPNVGDAVQSLQDNAETHSVGKCATYVREALNDGGFDVKPPDDGGHGYAKDFGPSLESVGFSSVASDTQPATYPASGYTPVKGDVAVIQSTTRSIAGHMAMYDGSNWISDFKQNGFWPGTSYSSEKPSYTIYRYPQ